MHAVINHNEEGFTVNIDGETITRGKILLCKFHLRVEQTCSKQCRCYFQRVSKSLVFADWIKQVLSMNVSGSTLST